MSNQKIVTETALSALASDIKTALSGKANSNDVYPKSQTYNRTEIDNALDLKADKSELYNVYPTDQESGSIASFTDGADNIPVKSIVSQIVAAESGSGTKSPTNPYTISGFDSGVVTRCGKNLFDTSKIRNGYFLTDGFHDYADWKGICIPVKSGDTYIISGMVNQAGGVRYAFIKDRNNLYSEFQLSWGSTTINGSFTVPEGFNGFWIPIATPNLSANIQVEKGSTATTYEAYNGNAYTFTFGQTVYGGHFDNKGNLVVTWSAIDLGSLTWTYDSTYDRFLSNSFNIDALPSTRTMKCLCSCYQTISDGRPLAQVPNNSIYNGGGGKNLIVHDNRFTVGTDLKTALSGQYCTYQLDTPITLAITSQDIPTLLGENNIFSNCGDVEVDYRADIGLYIDKKISSLAQG